MESTFVRAFIVMLALTGFGASTVTARHGASSTKVQAQDTVVGGPALCLPNDPNFCGIH